MAVSSYPTYTRRKTVLTLRDYMATQGILVVSVALIFCMLQFFAPQYAHEVLLQWQRLIQILPTVQQLFQMIIVWFV